MNDTSIFQLIGFLVIGVGSYWLYSNLQKLKHWIKTTGRVVDHRWKDSTDTNGDRTRTAIEIFSFTVNGENIQAEGKISSSHPFGLNEDVEIMYDPENPREIRVITVFRIYIFPSLIIFMGFVLTLFV